MRVLMCLAIAVALPFPQFGVEWNALGPFGGSAAVVQADPHAPNTVVAGTSNGLLFRSVDNGETWTPLRFPLELQVVLHALVIDPRVPGVYLAGVSPLSQGHSGLLRSTDRGATWQEMPGLRNEQVRAIAIFRGSSQVMIAGTDHGVFLSRDGAANWVRVSQADDPELQAVVSVAFDPNDSSTFYAGTPHLPWKTTDAGATWSSIHSGMIDDSDVFSVVVDRNRRERVFASACSGIYRSLNGGATWRKLNEAKGASFRTYTIIQDPQYENVLFAGTTNGTIRSRDGGTSWEKLAPYETRSISFDMRRLGRIYIATGRDGILRSEDNGKTWQRVNKGFCNRQLTPLAVGADGSIYTSTIYDPADGGIFRLPSVDGKWSKLALDGRMMGGTIIQVRPVSRVKLYAGTSSGLYLSRDAGKNWTRVTGPEDGLQLTGFLAPQWLRGRFVVSAGSRLFTGDDSAGVRIRARLKGAATEFRSLVALDSPLMAAIAGTEVWLSSDGETWTGLARPAGVADVTGIVQISTRRFVESTSAGVRISDDMGRTWKRAGGPLEGNTVQAICRHPVQSSRLFAARYGMVYESTDGGANWAQITGSDWPVASVKQLVVTAAAPDRLIVLSREQGVFVIGLPALAR
jgi:photosystem II stability/assembly factor-like uncharacterized protein